jgi:signal transduction histidine kinase
VYVISDQLIGSGPIGGVVITLEGQAVQLARLVLEIARDPKLVRSVETDLAPVFDWRELRRWGISEDRLPPGSAVLYREPNVWDQYKAHILGATGLLALQSALIARLMVQRARRRRMEHALRENQQRLHAIVDQNQDLAGRLITAQEAERTRIARDLHDDASQEVAGLAMSLSLLKARVSRASADGDVAEALTDLQEKTVAIGENLRTLSHELHPGVLQHAGVVAALRSYSTEFERRQGIRTRFEAVDALRDLAPEVALCLYRVGQEALTNAGRHSGADEVVVTLDRPPGCVQLSVRDNGRGFHVENREGRGLGLRSIDERVRLRGGWAQVTSSPGHGTMVLVCLPAPDMTSPDRTTGHGAATACVTPRS